MKVISVFCTNCGAAAQLDSQRKTGFCSYCGSHLLLDDEKQRIELSGNVSVDGMLTLEKQLKSVETLCKLGQFSKANNILEKLTHEYPEDYRVWWLSAYEAMSEPYNVQRGIYGEKDSCHFSAKAYKQLNLRIAVPVENIKNALSLAPEEQRAKLGISAAKWLASFIDYFGWAEERTTLFLEYVDTYKKACEESERDYCRAKARRSRTKVIAVILPIVLYIALLTFGASKNWSSNTYIFLFCCFFLSLLICWSWAKNASIVEHPWSWYRKSRLRNTLPIDEEQYNNLFEGSYAEIRVNDECFVDVSFSTPSITRIQSRAEYIKRTTREFEGK